MTTPAWLKHLTLAGRPVLADRFEATILCRDKIAIVSASPGSAEGIELQECSSTAPQRPWSYCLTFHDKAGHDKAGTQPQAPQDAVSDWCTFLWLQSRILGWIWTEASIRERRQVELFDTNSAASEVRELLKMPLPRVCSPFDIQLKILAQRHWNAERLSANSRVNANEFELKTERIWAEVLDWSLDDCLYWQNALRCWRRDASPGGVRRLWPLDVQPLFLNGDLPRFSRLRACVITSPIRASL